MKLLLIHHESLTPETLPQTGGSIRLQHLISGIQHHLPGAQLTYLCKQSVEGNWQRHLHRFLDQSTWDVILCCQMEDACLLPSRDELCIPIVVDLYAPRLMEALYVKDNGSTARQLLLALDRADAYLYAHPIQKSHWEALLSLIGVDLREERLLCCPLGIYQQENSHESENGAEEPILIGGGRVWPWQNPWDNLTVLLEVLENSDAGTIEWFCPPDQEVPIEHPRLKVQDWTSRERYRARLSKAHIGLDLNPPSIERRYACAFRHMDMIGCGLPILSANPNAMTQSDPDVCSMVDFNDPNALRAQLDFFLTHPPTSAIESVQTERHPHKSITELIAFLKAPSRRAAADHEIIQALHPTQQAHAAVIELEECQAKLHSVEQDNERQRTLLEQANTQVQQHSASMIKTASALEQIASFKNDIAHSWSDILKRQQDTIQGLQAQIANLQADTAKKSAELHAMDLLRARLENDLQHTRKDLESARKSRWRR